MVALLDNATVRTRLKLNNAAQTVDAVQSAIDGVNPWLENFLQSKFDAADYEDVFYTDFAAGVNPLAAKMFRLKCSTGFIRPDSTIIVYYDDAFENAMQSTAQQLDPVKMKVNYEKGYVFVPESLADMYVRITYSAGFSEGEALPKWLTESAFARCVRLLTLGQNGEIKQGLLDTLKMIDQHGAGVLDAHLRALSTAISPIQ